LSLHEKERKKESQRREKNKNNSQYNQEKRLQIELYSHVLICKGNERNLALDWTCLWPLSVCLSLFQAKKEKKMRDLRSTGEDDVWQIDKRRENNTIIREANIAS
jgi:hypothetical protein